MCCVEILPIKKKLPLQTFSIETLSLSQKKKNFWMDRILLAAKHEDWQTYMTYVIWMFYTIR
jgi:hypothetical protein